jgi:hypothetical protein
MEHNPRKLSNRSRRNNRSGKNRDGVIKGNISFLTNVTFTSVAAVQLTMDNSICLALAELDSVYRFFRWTRVKVTIYQAILGTGTAIAAWYIPSGVNTAPTSIVDCEAEHMTYTTIYTSNAMLTVPQSFVIPRRSLINEVQWFLTSGAGGIAELDGPGRLAFATTTSVTSATYRFKLDVDYEFKGILEPSINMLAESQKRLTDIRRKMEADNTE